MSFFISSSENFAKQVLFCPFYRWGNWNCWSQICCPRTCRTLSLQHNILLYSHFHCRPEGAHLTVGSAYTQILYQLITEQSYRPETLQILPSEYLVIFIYLCIEETDCQSRTNLGNFSRLPNNLNLYCRSCCFFIYGTLELTLLSFITPN